MFIITVIPTSNIPRQETLTYFYKHAIPVGALVQIPYNTKTLKALVISSTPISKVKGDVKKEAFQLKKITDILTTQKISEKRLSEILHWSTDSFLRTSTVLYDIYPTWYWDADVYSTEKKSITPTKEYVISKDIHERFERYKTEMKKGKVVWICVPHLLDNQTMYKTLTKTWPNTFFFHSKIDKTKQYNQFAEIQHTTDSVCVISSPFYIGLALELADVLIFDEYGDSAYKIHPPYYYDTRLLLENMSHTIPKIIFGDYVSSFTDTLVLKKRKSLPTFSHTVYTKISKRHNMLFVHPKIEESFKNDIAHKKNILLVCQNEEQKQKIVCNDCKKSVSCSQCQSDLYLKPKKGVRSLSCDLCLKKYPLKMTCVYCGSWNLETLGLYKKNITEYIAQEYTNSTDTPITIESFKNLYKYVSKKTFDRIYVLSVDVYLSSFDFNHVERIYRLMSQMSILSPSIQIQTSFPAPNLLTDLKTQIPDTWFSEEKRKREIYHFPPFGVAYTIRATSFKGIGYLNQVETLLIKKEIPYTRPGSTSIYLYVLTSQSDRYTKFLKHLQHKDIIIIKET